MDAIKALQWRYAVKRFDPQKKLSNEQLERILEATNLSAASYGVQAYKMIIIEDAELRREKLRLFTFNHQITEASHLILFAIQTDLESSYAEGLVDLIERERQLPLGNLMAYKESIMNFINSLDRREREVWQSEQAHIALGTLLYYCALEQIDACPIGGFSKEEFDEVLGLKEKKLRSLVLTAIGYRSAEDEFQYFKKVRKPLSEMILKY
ncbi:MAG: NAD(P)H-dependent oxidoreductase [Flavobacteriales bacterium AspAUS03]